MSCVYGAFYVGKMKHPFHKSIHDHIYYTPKINTPMGRLGVHNYDAMVYGAR